ncbi:ABC-2 type transport system permease protein [Saccharothrix saharensis]|uniref:ABC-2 type transport system permease protein n=1 Tax=Saccharothrix saharensis TaxID=571190 RepID=A0A543JAB2_9PSEU|nr:ABC transporter permease subunit [Saccharothrix saharensis]TQM79770.1 ABC-2 type transport system permease protein [Saccharothrix saharensis]
MKEALHVEWTKLRTVAGTAWLLAAVVLLTAAAGVAASAACAGTGCGDPVKTSLTGVVFGQAVVAVLAVLAVGGEYGTGMIRVTLAALPRRSTVLAAKAAVVGALVLAAGAVAVLVAVPVGRVLLADVADAPVDGVVVRAAVGSVLYLVLVGLLSVGVATAVRDAAAAIGLVLGLLYLFPVVAAVVSDPDWVRRLQRISPMTAGLAVQATTNLDALSISPWAGLGVLGLWAAGALLVGGVLLRLRDA